MPNPGIHINEQATTVSSPNVATVGIPFVVGLAPSHAASNPAKANMPVLATSWEDAVEKLGFSDDWKTYTLCEFMYAHFQLYGCQPVIFCNVMEPATMKKEAETKEYAVRDHRISLPFGTIDDAGLKVSAGGADLVKDEDYTVLYDETNCIVELLASGSAYDAANLNVSGNVVTPENVVAADIVTGLEQVDACMTTVGVIPDLICAPGYSHITTVAAVMATKAAGINGLFGAKALIDCDSSENGVRKCSELLAYKNASGFVDENQIVCWPFGTSGGRKFHMSTQIAGLMAQVDTENGGIPYESSSNKSLKIDGLCLEDGTEVNLTWEQVKLITGSYGIVTGLNFMSTGWTAKGNYTACYPTNTDVKDYLIPVSRMFDFVGNTIIRTFWSKLDKPMNRRLIDTILDTCNIWLGGLVGAEYLLGARAELREDENPTTDLMDGIIRIHVYITPPGPAEEFDFTVEYDVSYVAAVLAA